jgi:hypothetical protein
VTESPTPTHSYRLMRHTAVATVADGVTVTEDWFTVSCYPGGKVEVPTGEQRRVARSAQPLPELHEDYADEELVGSGFVRLSDWVTRADGSLAAEVDWHDPTP